MTRKQRRSSSRLTVKNLMMMNRAFYLLIISTVYVQSVQSVCINGGVSKPGAWRGPRGPGRPRAAAWFASRAACLFPVSTRRGVPERRLPRPPEPRLAALPGLRGVRRVCSWPAPGGA